MTSPADAASQAAQHAGVRIREIDKLEDLAAVCRLFHEIWRPDPENPPATPELLRAFTKAGNYVAAAFDDRGLAGACVGFFGPPAEATLHSHVAGVVQAARGTGFALKLHQRAWAMQRGATRIAWTFDPLVRRNAWFNLAKLGAVAVEYLPDFYGDMNDAINGNDATDRLLVHWDLDSPGVAAACDGKLRTGDHPDTAVVALGRSEQGWPEPRPADGPAAKVAIPRDIERLRVTDPACAAQWRIAVRDALSHGATITGFEKAGWYVVRQAK